MQIPLWQLAGVPSYAVVEPHMHRTGDQLDYVAAATPGSLVASATGTDGRQLSPGAVAAIVLISVGVLCMAAAAAALLVVSRRKARHQSTKVTFKAEVQKLMMISSSSSMAVPCSIG